MERKPRAPKLIFYRFIHDIFKYSIFKRQLHIVHLKQFDVLLDDGILRFRKNGAQCRTVQRIQISQHRKAADNLGNQSERLQILRSNVLHHVALINGCRIAYSAIPDNVRIQPLGNFLFNAIESPHRK